MNAQQPTFATVVVGGVRWHVRPECLDPFFGPAGLLLPTAETSARGLPGGLPLDAWLNDGRAAVIKHGPHRTVYRLQLPGFDIFLKHNRVHNARALLRQFIRPSKSRMECDRARTAAVRGVSTFMPLAVGETGWLWPGDSFLITRTLEDVEPLDTFLELTLPTLAPLRQARIRQAVAATLGAFLARLHDAGLIHNDLHAGNMLIRLEGDDRPELFLIDLHAVEFGDPLTWPASRDNLIILGRWFTVRAHRADRLRFWEAYHQARRDWGGRPPLQVPPVLARELERSTWRSNLAFWKNRDGRCLVNNRYYQRLKRRGRKGYVVRDLDRESLARLLADPDEPFRHSGAALIKDSPSSTVVEVTVGFNGLPRRAIYKRFRVTQWLDPWLALVRPTGALRSWVMGQGLRERLLPTPRPLAMFHRLNQGRLAEGYLLVEKVEDARELAQFVNDLRGQPEDQRRAALRRTIDRLAVLLRELHRRRLSHRDLKASNILVSGERLWFIDLVGVRRHHKLGRRRRVQNLARLNASFFRHPGVTRTDKLRFLRLYLQWGLLGRRGWKAWWHEVEQTTRAKVARNARVGRQLT